MDRSSTWEVNPDGGKDNTASYEVLAFARDKESGVPVYIMDLDQKHSGLKCGCECPSCNLDLIAVNPGKKPDQCIRRPHFRHPAGAIKSDCMFISARLAAMRLFQSEGFILLPKRNRTATSIGISGNQYNGFYETLPQRVAIKEFSFKDRAVAILTLADGRKLHVDLVGKGSVISDDGKPTGYVSLNINDPAIAGMSLEQIRANLSLIPDHLCWLSHWDDAELTAQALADAERKADDFMDLQSRYATELEFIDKNLRHETVLHWEVKKILAEAMHLRVPKLESHVSKTAANGREIKKAWIVESHVVPLLSVETEQPFGRIIPDVVAQTAPEHGNTLLVEVTVTNTIDEDRIARIRNQNLPTLEIDMSRSGGLVSRDDLKEIVLNGLELKRWIHHPLRDQQSELLTSQVDDEVNAINHKLNKEKQQIQDVLDTPIVEILDEYLSLIMEIAEFDTLDSIYATEMARLQSLKSELASVSGKLAIHGYPESGDELLTLGRQGIIPRVLSIKLGRGVGYKLNSTMEVMNAIKQSSGRNSSNHTIYMIAEKVYRHIESPQNPSWYVEWVNEVKRSIKAEEQTYIRDRKYDDFLSLLFPEMSSSLSRDYTSKKSSTFDANQKCIENMDYWRSHTERSKQIVEFYKDSNRNGSGRNINFDEVLADLQSIKQGDHYFKWFHLWNARYSLNNYVYPIANFLDALGYPNVANDLQVWTSYVRSGIWDPGNKDVKYPEHSKVGSPYVFKSNRLTTIPEGAKPNAYAEMKGRSAPRPRESLSLTIKKK